MAAVNHSFDSLSFLSDALREMVRRRLREILGTALIVTAILLALALASWSVQDPSLSHATNNPVRNLVGLTGAIAADLMMQLLGLGALAVVLPIAVWGWRLAGHRPLGREWLRLAAFVVAVLLAAAFASCLPRSHAWPLPAGLGGVIGDGILRAALALARGALPGWQRALLALLAGAGALFTLAITCGIGFYPRQVRPQRAAARTEAADGEDDESEARPSISLGWIVHGLLSLKWRFTRWLVHRRSGSIPIRGAGASPRARTEPRFDSPNRAAPEPDSEDDEDECEDDEEPARARKPRSAPRPRRSSDGYVLPSLNLLAAPRTADRATMSAE